MFFKAGETSADGKAKLPGKKPIPEMDLDLKPLPMVSLSFPHGKYLERKKPCTIVLEIGQEIPRCSGRPLLLAVVEDGKGKILLSKSLESRKTILGNHAPGELKVKIKTGIFPSNPKEGILLLERQIRLEPGQSRTIHIKNLKLGKITGEIRIEDGNRKEVPGSDMKVRIWTKGGWCSTLSGDDGSFVFENLVPGKAFLQVGEGPISRLSGSCMELRVKENEEVHVSLVLRKAAGLGTPHQTIHANTHPK